MVALAAVPDGDTIVGMVELLEERATTAETELFRLRTALERVLVACGAMAQAAPAGTAESHGLTYLHHRIADALEQP